MRKQLLYLTNNRLTAATWQSGKLTVDAHFTNSEEGYAAFAAYLEDRRNLPAQVLIDLIEEDFQRDTVPHVLGKTRQTLIQRRLTQLYRDTPYRHASLQGREPEGRRDDRMLFSALLNADLPKPWLGVLLAQKVPVAGIYSVALLNSLLFDKLQLGHEPLLLVTHLSSGLRQSYFHDGQFRFSRLTQLSSEEPQTIAETADTEIAKTRQFLASTRQLQRDQPIRILMLTDDAIARAMQNISPDTATSEHRYQEPAQTAALIGAKEGVFSLCDSLFMSLLAASRVPSHYALPEHNRFYGLWQARIALYALSAVTVAGSLYWAGANTMDFFEVKSEKLLLEKGTRAVEARYQTLMSGMPASVTNARDMKAAVDLENLIEQNSPSLEGLLSTISAALDKQPQVKINQLHWQVSATDPDAAEAAQSQPPAPQQGEPQPAAGLIGIPKKPFEIVTIEGEITPFANDYRSALEIMRQLTADLERNKQIKATVTQPPIDVRPTSSIKGKAGKEDEQSVARFELKLVRRP